VSRRKSQLGRVAIVASLLSFARQGAADASTTAARPRDCATAQTSWRSTKHPNHGRRPVDKHIGIVRCQAPPVPTQKRVRKHPRYHAHEPRLIRQRRAQGVGQAQHPLPQRLRRQHVPEAGSQHGRSCEQEVQNVPVGSNALLQREARLSPFEAYGESLAAGRKTLPWAEMLVEFLRPRPHLPRI
jgi:hypothetical protein